MPHAHRVHNPPPFICHLLPSFIHAVTAWQPFQSSPLLLFPACHWAPTLSSHVACSQMRFEAPLSCTYIPTRCLLEALCCSPPCCSSPSHPYRWNSTAILDANPQVPRSTFTNAGTIHAIVPSYVTSSTGVVAQQPPLLISPPSLLHAHYAELPPTRLAPPWRSLQPWRRAAQPSAARLQEVQEVLASRRGQPP